MFDIWYRLSFSGSSWQLVSFCALFWGNCYCCSLTVNNWELNETTGSRTEQNNNKIKYCWYNLLVIVCLKTLIYLNPLLDYQLKHLSQTIKPTIAIIRVHFKSADYSYPVQSNNSTLARSGPLCPIVSIKEEIRNNISTSFCWNISDLLLGLLI